MRSPAVRAPAPDHDHQHRHGRDALGDGGRRRRLPPQPAPVGDYQLQVKRNGEDVGESVAVNVALGGTTTVNLGSAAAW